jgi:hypothetical protein
MAGQSDIVVRWPEGVRKPEYEGISFSNEPNAADLVVLTSTEPDQAVPRTGSGRRPIYVLLEDDSFATIERAWQISGVVGCGRIVDGSLPPDLLRILSDMVRRREAENGSQSPIQPHSNPPQEGSFVTLTLGRMRRYGRGGRRRPGVSDSSARMGHCL